MTRQIEEIPLINLKLNTSSDIPLYIQLYNLFRMAILESKFPKGYRLPGSRSLAKELKISRNTVTLAFDQLRIEGYISGKTGKGTFVSEIPDYNFPEKKIDNNKSNRKSNHSLEGKFNLQFGSPELIERHKTSDRILPFQNGISALEQFPIRIWQKIINQTSQAFTISDIGYGDAAGYHPLREAIAFYLNRYRAVNCNAEQIIIVNGIQQGLDLIGRVLIQPGNNVWIEDPGYFGTRASLSLAGANIYASPLDNEGMDIEQASKQNPRPEIIFATPSHQFPLGFTMSVSRRLNLLHYAKKNMSWIIEDDYDSEFRYYGNSLPSLQGMDRDGHVIYLGTFSKVLFPGLRLGYMVLPNPGMVSVFTSMKSLIDRQNPIFEQMVLTKFIEEGHFTRHIRKMRMLYKSRQQFLIDEINREFNGLLKVNESPAGMHIIAWLPENLNDKEISRAALNKNIIVRALSDYSIKYFYPPGLILGYAAFNEISIKKSLSGLKKILLNYP